MKDNGNYPKMSIKKSKNGFAKIHNVRFYNLSPRSINCLALDKSKTKLALSRSDRSIEIWDVQHAALLEKTITSDSSVEDLAWAGCRLFSAGITGELIEWDLNVLLKKKSQFVTGSSIWCIDINLSENYMAVGTEEGYLNIFDIGSEDLIYKDLFDKQEGRILCCKYDHSGDYIVTGSLDVIRIWNTETGHVVRKMATGRLEANRETIVWSLVILKNFNIISGDSRGQITIWDGHLGTQLEAHQVLKADVFAVAVNEEENILMCSGVEPIIRIYSETTITQKDGRKNKCWVKFIQRSVHDHDVKALVCGGDNIYSGGVDGYLGVSTYNKVRNSFIIKHGPFLQGPTASVATEDRLILLRYPAYFEIWKLGEPHEESILHDDKQQLYPIKEKPKKLLEFRSINDELIMTTGLSNNGKWLLYSTINSIRLFSFQLKDDKPSISRIKYLPDQFEPCIRAKFSVDSKYLYIVKFNNQVEIFELLETGEIDPIETLDISKSIKGICNFLEISNNGQYIVLGGTCHTISIWQKDSRKRKYKFFLKLPLHSSPISAIALHKNIPKLVVSFADNKIFEYDLDEMCFTFSTSKHFVDNSLFHPISNILLDERNENIIILHNDTYLYVLEKIAKNDECNGQDFNMKQTAVKKKKFQVKSKEEENQNSNKSIEIRCRFKKIYEHLVHLIWLTDREIVAVGVNPVSLIEELPSALKQKKFGV